MSESDSYHGQPVLKEPIWTWEIPTYFFTGGLGGASAGLAYLSGLRGNDVLARRAWAGAMAGIGVSPLFLISDLGRPMRFLNMFRMFKITSPMSVGSWILGASGAATTVAAANAWTGWLPRSSRIARPAAALLGLPVSTYTAALIANTAVPVWHEAYRMLPFVYGSGAAQSAAAAAVLSTPPAHAAPARRLAIAGALTEIAVKEIMHQRLGEHGEPYKRGAGALFGHISRACNLTGAALLYRQGSRSRAAAMAGAALLCAGAFSARWSTYKAGFQSAADPKYVVGPQRRMIERQERRGAARLTPTVDEIQPGKGSPATAEVNLSAS
jgi:Polysulphide reductase, NrfD